MIDGPFPSFSTPECDRDRHVIEAALILSFPGSRKPQSFPDKAQHVTKAAASTMLSGEGESMDIHGAFELQGSQSGPALSPSPQKRSSLKTRKVTIRLTEKLHEQLEAATKRPGVGKSMVVESALEGFLNPAPSAEELMRERSDDISVRFDRLEHDLRIMAETIALHARYHLAIMPPLPPSCQREAIRIGDERFKILVGTSRSPRAARSAAYAGDDRAALSCRVWRDGGTIRR